MSGGIEEKAFSPEHKTSEHSFKRGFKTSARQTMCFAEAQRDPSILSDRQTLTKFYLDEVELMKAKQQTTDTDGGDDEAGVCLGVPEHTPALRQPSGSRKTIRVAQWNINVLHGADNVGFSMPQQPTAIIQVLKKLNADVLLLQEAWKLSYPEGKGPNWPDSSNRVHDFLKLLPSLGYEVVACEEENNFNPSILATRLPILATGKAFSTDLGRHNFATNMQAQRSPEMRAARIVDLALGNAEEDLSTQAPTLTTVVTHFHHNEAPAAPTFGIRKGEAQAVVAECDRWEANRSPQRRTAGSATLLATDFNGVRRADFELEEEWELQAACMAKLKQPADDGVAHHLEANGFRCTYDAPGMVAPKLTHWTNTVLDFAYVRQAQTTKSKSWSVKGVYVVPTTVSDHLPVVHDLVYTPPKRRHSHEQTETKM